MGVIVPRSAGGTQSSQAGSSFITVRSTPASFGAAAAEGIARVGQAAEQVGEERFRFDVIEKRNADEARTLQSLVTGDTTWRNDSFGDDGFLRQEGGNAIGITERGLQRYNDIGEEIANGLDNESQRRMFTEAWQQRHRFAADTLTRHEVAEVEKYRAQANSSFLANERSRALHNALDDEALADAISNVLSKTSQIADEAGMHNEARDRLAREEMTPIIEGVVALRSAVDPEGAARILEQHRDKVDGSRLEAITKTLRDNTLTVLEQQGAELALQHSDDLEEQVAFAKSRWSGERQDGIVARLKDAQGIRDTASARRNAAKIEGTFEKYRGEAGKFANGLVPPERASTLLDQALRELPNEQSKQAFTKWWDTVTAGRNVATNWNTYAELLEYTPEQWASEPIENYRHRLADTEFKELAKVRKAALAGGSGTAADLTKRTKNAALESGLVSSAKQGEEIGRFHRRVRAAVDAFSSANGGRYPTTSEINEIIDIESAVAARGVISRFDAKRYEQSDEDVIKSMATGDRALAIWEASKQGKNRSPAEADIVAAHTRLQIEARKAANATGPEQAEFRKKRRERAAFAANIVQTWPNWKVYGFENANHKVDKDQ